MDLARPRDSLIALDLLRFIAAAMVMHFHYYAMWIHDPTPTVVALMQGVAAHEPSDPFTVNGTVGVQIFFVLSGYVIAASARRGDAGDFVWRRWLRLWPAAALCSLITSIVLLLHGATATDLWQPALASATLWPIEPLIDPSYWTLGIECAFYALVAGLLAVGRWRPMVVAQCMAIVSALFWLIMFADQLDGMRQRSRIEELLLLRHGALFALGIMIQLHHSRERVLTPLLLAPALYGSAMSVMFGSISAEQLGFVPHPVAAIGMFFGGLAVIAYAPTLQPALARLRLARLSVWLGLATYPLYLLHQRVGLALIGDLVRAGTSTRAATLITIALMIATALVIANIVEPRLRAALNRWRPARSVHGLRPDSRRSAFPRGG